MSAEEGLFIGSGNLASLQRNTTLDTYHHPGAAFSPSNRERRCSSQRTPDERRLLGDYREDKNAVPIGDPAKRFKPPDHSVKPTNTLSLNARSSRPTLAQGPSRISKLGSQTPTTRTNCLNRARLGLHPEQNSSPRKRPRTGAGQPKHDEVIELDDSDEPLPNENKPTRLNEHFGRRFGNGLSAASSNAGVPEFREVDRTVAPRPPTRPRKSRRIASSDLEFDENFMNGATAERRNRTSGAYPTREPNTGLAPAVMKRVEVLGSSADRKNGSFEKEGKRNSEQDAAMNRDSTAHESPDELQGEITIRKSISRSPRSANLRGSDASPRRRSMSPSRIQPGSFTKSQKDQRSKKLKKSTKTPGKGSKREFNLKLAQLGTLRFDETTYPEGGALTIGDSDLLFSLANGESDGENHRVPIQNIVKAFYGTDPSTKVRLPLRRTSNAGLGTLSLYLEFSTVKQTSDFIRSLESHGCAAGMKVDEKPGDWMDGVFRNRNNSDVSTTPTRQNTGSKRSSPGNKKTDGDVETKPDTRKRSKLNESLQDETGNSREHTQTQARDRSLRQSNIVNVDDHSSKSQSEVSGDGVKPRRSIASDMLPLCRDRVSSISRFLESRETRSKSRKQEAPTTSDEKQVSPLKLDEPIPKWPSPLLYPRFGKRKAEVEAHDLERLRDHEFLNDNLVGFYLRFLEHHIEVTNPDLAKRIYIFNSYFFASLTNTPRGTRGINYQAVSKWTRLVDIFSRDYIVVPINENAHWYVAIICNLPELRPESDESEAPTTDKEKTDAPPAQPSGELTSVPGSEANTEGDGSDKKYYSKKETASSDGDERHARKDFASLTLSDQKEEAAPTEDAGSEKEDWPEEDENPISPAIKHTPRSKPETRGDKFKSPENPPTSSSPQVAKGTSTQPKKPPRKSAGPPARKYDSKQPIIISFDSLGCPRSPTITILRNYLEEEAKSKRSMTINRTDILGMTAKGIPEQPNYSDCGLYLLAYLEKFAQDPDEFIRKLLNREMVKQNDWPKMESRVLRKRLRDFLIDLHDEQENESKKKEAGSKSAVDAQPLQILLKPSDESMNDSPPARESPMGLKKAQLEASNNPASSPTSKLASPSKKFPSTPEETQKPPVEEIPGTPTEPSQPTILAEGHQASQPEVPCTPEAYFTRKDRTATPTGHIKLVEGTPSPKRRSPRHTRTPGKQSSTKSSNGNEADQSDRRSMMDDIQAFFSSPF